MIQIKMLKSKSYILKKKVLKIYNTKKTFFSKNLYEGFDFKNVLV